MAFVVVRTESVVDFEDGLTNFRSTISYEIT
jgi:hypothetical protein